MKYEDQIRYKIGVKIGETIGIATCMALLDNEPDKLGDFLNEPNTLEFAKEVMEKYNVQVDENEIRIQYIGDKILQYKKLTQLIYSICENMRLSVQKFKMLSMTLDELLDNPDLDDVSIDEYEECDDIDKISYEIIKYANEAYAKLKEFMAAVVEEERIKLVKASMEFDNIVDELHILQKRLKNELNKPQNSEEYLKMLYKSIEEAESGEFCGEDAK